MEVWGLVVVPKISATEIITLTYYMTYYNIKCPRTQPRPRTQPHGKAMSAPICSTILVRFEVLMFI